MDSPDDSARTHVDVVPDSNLSIFVTNYPAIQVAIVANSHAISILAPIPNHELQHGGFAVGSSRAEVFTDVCYATQCFTVGADLMPDIHCFK